MKRIFASALIAICFSAASQTVELEVLNGSTREKKNYEFATYKFDIPVNFVKGWNKCTALPIKKFTFYGEEAVRGDLYCSSTQNTTVNLSCVALKSKRVEVSIFTIYGGQFTIVKNESISADSFADITMVCKF